MADPILTLPEVADLLEVAAKTVYTMAQPGQIPAFKVRGQWRFKHDDLDAWIERDALKTPNEQRLKRMWEYRESRSAWDHVCISLYFSQEEWYAQESSFDHEQAWKLHVMHLLDPDQDRQYWAERSRKRREIKDLYDRNERAGRRCGVSAAAPVP